MATDPLRILTARTVKCTAMLDPAAIAAIPVPSGVPRFTVTVQGGGQSFRAVLNATTLRRNQRTIAENGPDQCAVTLQGKLVGNELQEAGINVAVRTPKPAQPENTATS